MKQSTLDYETAFEKQGGKIPFDAPVSTVEEKVRLSRQTQKILDRLIEGPVTNRELSGIALQYNRGIKELREAGHRIPKPEQNHETGLAVYHLEEASNGR